MRRIALHPSLLTRRGFPHDGDNRKVQIDIETSTSPTVSGEAFSDHEDNSIVRVVRLVDFIADIEGCVGPEISRQSGMNEPCDVCDMIETNFLDDKAGIIHGLWTPIYWQYIADFIRIS